jgi:sporulation protein YlmC with PRC-barrel domain
MGPDMDTGPADRHRLGELLGAPVALTDGTAVGQVDDVRLTGGPGLQGYVVDGLVVGTRGEGTLLGYDRRGVRGPWLLRVLVRRANRDARYVPWPAVRRIDWEGPRVVVDRVEPLEDERPPA